MKIKCTCDQVMAVYDDEKKIGMTCDCGQKHYLLDSIWYYGTMGRRSNIIEDNVIEPHARGSEISLFSLNKKQEEIIAYINKRDKK